MNSQGDVPKDYFRKEKFVMKILGVSFSGNESILYKIYSFSVMFLFNFMYFIFDSMELSKVDFEIAPDIIPYVFAAFMSMAKISVVFRNRTVIKSILDKLEKEPFAINLDRGGEQERKILNECLLVTHVQSMSYWISGAITISITAIASIIKRILNNDDSSKWNLPNGQLTFLNITYSPNFEITWIYQNLSIVTIAYYFMSTDILLASILVHISYQFKILQNGIKRMVARSFNKMPGHNSNINALLDSSGIDGSVIPWKHLQTNLKEIIDYHSAILELADGMEAVFSDLLLLVILGALGMLCFLIFQASTFKDPVQATKTFTETFTICLQLVVICYWGEQIIAESQEVGKAAYEANFVGTDLRFQKALIVIIRRSQDPTKLTAGKFTDICLTPFVWILRTSYSAFMVIRGSN